MSEDIKAKYSLPEGTKVGRDRYRIVRFIGSGAFGYTYEAEHLRLGMHVAVKELFVREYCNRDSGSGRVTVGTEGNKARVEKIRRKFVEEASALSLMNHKGIVRVMDEFEERGTAYYVMDYIKGSSLRQILNKEGRLSEGRALRYIRQVCDALDYVHSRDRLHLDIKPENIMIDGEDNAILIDFGVSKQYEDGENLTTILGCTPGYAPLEQMGHSVRKFYPATDIYAVGATLYALLTGMTPPPSNLLASGEETLKPLPSTISDATRRAVEEAMRTIRTLRPQSIEYFLKILNGPIIKSGPKPVKKMTEDTGQGEATEIGETVWEAGEGGKTLIDAEPQPVGEAGEGEKTLIDAEPQPVEEDGQGKKTIIDVEPEILDKKTIIDVMPACCLMPSEAPLEPDEAAELQEEPEADDNEDGTKWIIGAAIFIVVFVIVWLVMTNMG